MGTAREAVEGIEQWAQILQTLPDAELEQHRRLLQTIAGALPMQKGERVCANCTQRLAVIVRPVTRDGGNGHCTRSTRGHDVELV